MREELVEIWRGKRYNSAIYKGKSGYHVVVEKDGELWCSCLSFKFRKKCKHIKWFLEDIEKKEVDVDEILVK